MSNIQVKVVNENPNAKVVTLEANQDFLGLYAKITIPRGSRLIEYSPFAQMVFEHGKDVNRIDFFAKDGKTYISIARKFIDWTDASKESARKITANFLATGKPIIYVEAINNNFTSHVAFQHGGHPVKKLVQTTFHEQVNPLLAKDGGAMELLNVEVKPTGEISSDVALLGSCNGCTSAQDTTLQAAVERIRLVLDTVKEQHTNNPAIKALKFTGIKVSTMEEIILSKPRAA